MKTIIPTVWWGYIALIVTTSSLLPQLTASAFHYSSSPSVITNNVSTEDRNLILSSLDMTSGSGDGGDDSKKKRQPKKDESIIQNFRQAAGLSPHIYRCASTDGLSELINDDSRWLLSNNKIGDAERKVLFETGLILDLRSPSERKEQQAKRWSSLANFIVRDASADEEEDLSFMDDKSTREQKTKERNIVRIDVLSPTRFFRYADEYFLTPSQKAMSALYMIANADKAHELRIEALNERGLAGLNEVILLTGGSELCLALKLITRHLERQNNDDHDSGIVIHCVQGKDRTGMLVMLCQSMLGLSDDVIIDDYFQSNQMRKTGSGSAAANDIVQKPRRRRGKLDRNVFAGTSREAMIKTLELLRKKYGSVSPGYLNSIGFDDGWRDRFVQAMMKQQQRKEQQKLLPNSARSRL